MATLLLMPKLGLTMVEGTIVKWLKQDGQAVEKGEPVVVVMSKKITYEVQAPAAGVVHILAQPKESRPVSVPIGAILAPGEPPPDLAKEMPAGGAPAAADEPAPLCTPAAAEPAREVRASPASKRLARELGVDLGQVQGTGEGGRITETDVQRAHDRQAEQVRIQATPLARRMAEEEGLDLGRIQGTGPGGRVTEDDVLRSLEEEKGPGAPLPGFLPFSGMRQAIAVGMMSSLHSMAQLTLTARADVTELAALRDVFSQRFQERISYTDLAVKAVARALRDHPLLNSTLAGDRIILHEQIHIGVAVALEQGLIVPVVRDADRKTILEIHRAVHELAEHARQGRLTVDKVEGGTFTVTNLGMYGVEAFTPIINPPEAAILGLGSVNQELALLNGQVVARSRLTLSLTIDHRVVDGAPGASFLQTLVRMLEHPALIFAGPEG